MTETNTGQPLAIVPRDHAEILHYESGRVFSNGAIITNPLELDEFLSRMIDLNEKIKKHNEWEDEYSGLLKPSGSIQDRANLASSVQSNWNIKVAQEKEIDGLIHLLNLKLHNATFARYPPYELSNPWTTLTPPTTTSISPVITTTTSRSFIAATIVSSTITSGDKIIMAGTAAGGSKSVYITISSLDGSSFLTKQYTAPVYSDESFMLQLDSFAFPKGHYGVVLELPTGESTRLQFIID